MPSFDALAFRVMELISKNIPRRVSTFLLATVLCVKTKIVPYNGGYFRFYNEVAAKYPESRIVYSSKEGKLREKVIRTLLASSTDLTLDVGCNDGHYKPYIKRYVGLDIALPCLKRFKGARIWGLAELLPFRRSVFDRILMSEVLEHVENRSSILRESSRVLKRNGKMIVSTPHGSHPFNVCFFSVLSRYGVRRRPYVHGMFDEIYLEKLLTDNGFTIQRIVSLKDHLIMVAESISENR